jgi:hypothetical protein
MLGFNPWFQTGGSDRNIVGPGGVGALLWVPFWVPKHAWQGQEHRHFGTHQQGVWVKPLKLQRSSKTTRVVWKNRIRLWKHWLIISFPMAIWGTPQNHRQSMIFMGYSWFHYVSFSSWESILVAFGYIFFDRRVHWTLHLLIMHQLIVILDTAHLRIDMGVSESGWTWGIPPNSHLRKGQLGEADGFLQVAYF